MSLAAELLAVLVDPEDKQPLQYLADESCLYNTRSRRMYPVSATGIPVLLTSDATTTSDDEHARLLQLVDAGQATQTGTFEAPTQNEQKREEGS